MPCVSDYGPSDEELRERRVVQATLCGVLTALESKQALDTFWGAVDWREAGCTDQEARQWWTEHKRKDARRREREAAEAERQRLAEAARGKLSAAEREALGLDRNW